MVLVSQALWHASILSALRVRGKRDMRTPKASSVEKMICSRFSNRHCLKNITAVEEDIMMSTSDLHMHPHGHACADTCT